MDGPGERLCAGQPGGRVRVLRGSDDDKCGRTDTYARRTVNDASPGGATPLIREPQKA